VIVGFIGFGEVESTIAGGLAAAGVEHILAFDIASTDSLIAEVIGGKELPERPLGPEHGTS
jgi:3-hydroxyisobutyrate dehydrogenase-like beta-hydroxyacid dehydrogenase